ncbi:MAG TPA: response regulator [Candidatus Angelobacter sp.]|nr:response regulator [Candidatus Angelobacter sp.]
MPVTRILLVDDNQAVRTTMQEILEIKGFSVVAAASVNEALREIATAVDPFDVLLSDLHMPGRGDGLIVASAMRHANPEAVTLVMSAYPEMSEAAAAILLQADHVLLKPLNIKSLVKLIETKLSDRDNPLVQEDGDAADSANGSVTVATILEHNSAVTIAHWLERVNSSEDLVHITLTDTERTGHLPRLIQDLVLRLRKPQSLEGGRVVSTSAHEHGVLRRRQGYSAPMIVEESRMLQVSIFQTLQLNLSQVDFSLLLMNVMVVADEVDWQLMQAMRGFMDDQVTSPATRAA